MQIQENVPLAPYSTMRLGGNAAFLVEVTSEDELLEALRYAQTKNLKFHTIGSGSNTIFSADGFNGLIIVNKIAGISEQMVDGSLEITAGSGENWDDIVLLSVERGFSDIAALSLIPGTTGAAPVQNIGAYGQQISESIIWVKAIEVSSSTLVEIPREDCNFSYRHSRFNTTDRGRYIITSVKMRLSRKIVSTPFYRDIDHYFEAHDMDKQAITPGQLREAVSAVRIIKLPDPSVVANCGSFFKNPVVTPQEFETLKQRFPELKAHQTDDGNLKLYGAQLIELAGLKDYHDNATGMATWKNQALVLVNESARSTDDLLTFKAKLVAAVQDKFGITLEQEPEFLESPTSVK